MIEPVAGEPEISEQALSFLREFAVDLQMQRLVNLAALAVPGTTEPEIFDELKSIRELQKGQQHRPDSY